MTRTKAATRSSHESIYRFVYDQVRRTNAGGAPVDPSTT